MERCEYCGEYPVVLGSDARLCQSCEIAHIEEAALLSEVECVVSSVSVALGLGLSGRVSWT